jgi:hypothetical protein
VVQSTASPRRKEGSDAGDRPRKQNKEEEEEEEEEERAKLLTPRIASEGGGEIAEAHSESGASAAGADPQGQLNRVESVVRVNTER